MLSWMLLLLYYVVQCIEVGLPKSSVSNQVFNAYAGELYEICVSNRSKNLGNVGLQVPPWMCKLPFSCLYQGVPLLRNTFGYFHKAPISNIVVYNPRYTFHSRCKHRRPTVLVLLSEDSLSDMSSCERVKLWNKASQFLQQQMILTEDVKALERSLSVLSVWPPGFNKRLTSAVIYFVGCGSILESMITKLKSLEQQSYVEKVSNSLHLQIKSWIIADFHNPNIIRKRRYNNIFKGEQYSLSASSIFYLSEKLQRKQWSQGRVVIEGSGMYDQPYHVISEKVSTESSIIPSKQYTLQAKVIIPIVTQSNTMPMVKKSLRNVTIFIGTKLLYNILPDTYVDKEDGNTDKMKLKVYIRAQDTQSDVQVTFNNQQWIYYIPDQQIIVLQPRRNDGGFYNLVVCAYDSDKNRICDGTTITVRKPESFTKVEYFNAQSGVLWQYKLPEMWAEAVNSSEKDTLDIIVESSSLFQWKANASTINLITEAYISREHQLKITAESMESGRKLIWILIVTSVGHNAYRSATSVQIIIRLRSRNSENMPFRVINTMKDILISTIARYYHKRYSKPENILIFKVIDGRSILNSKDFDQSLTISFIYVPDFSFPNLSERVKCSEVIISQDLLSKIQVAFTNIQYPWIIEYVKLKSIPGRCNQDLKIYEESYISSTTIGVLQESDKNKEVSTWLNKTINITVRNGFVFKNIIVYSFQPEYNLIQKMELYDENNLITDDSSWISLSTSEFALYGLPMSENIRGRPYHLRLDVILKSGATQLVSVIVVVEAFTPNFGHTFEMVISISEGDAMAHRSSFSTDQLLLSNTLSYRWLLVQTLGSYLQSGKCYSQCGMDIFTHSLYEQRTWIVRFSWSVLLNTPDSQDSPSISQSNCNFQHIKSLYRSLIFSDPYTDLSVFPSTSNISSKPNDSLIKAFMSKHLGTPSSVSIQFSSPCFSPQNSFNSSKQLWSNITIFQGTIFAIKFISSEIISKGSNLRIRNSKLYFENNTICTLSWLRLSDNGNVLYGLPLFSDVQKSFSFSLRIYIEFLSGIKKNISSRITILPNIHIKEKSHMIFVKIQLRELLQDLNQRLKIVRLLNQYLHPSCTLINSGDSGPIFSFFDMTPQKVKHGMSCEKAEDVVLHHMNVSEVNGEFNLIIEWSQNSFEANRSYCNNDSVNNLRLELFKGSSSIIISEEFKRFFSNSGFGIILNVQLCLYGECSTEELKSNSCINKYVRSTHSMSNTSSNTKMVLLVLFMIIVVFACVSLGIYFVRRSKSDGISQLSSKESKNGTLGDHITEPKNVDKSPLPTVSKKPKKLIIQETTGINLSNNSPTTPLLSPFFREDSKFDRHTESGFNKEDITGSYSFAASRNKSPEQELSSTQESGVPMHSIKQPTTSNVIKNPAMMMGSRLNPYRNIPPSIK